MSERTPVTEVFAEVEPDPDAVLESFGADSPADVFDGDGAHDPTLDDVLDAGDETAAELFDELADVSLERTTVETVEGERGETTTTEAAVSDAEVSVLPGDGAAIDEFLGLTEPEPEPAVEHDGLSLVGAGPSPRRIGNDRFGAGRAG